MWPHIVLWRKAKDVHLCGRYPPLALNARWPVFIRVMLHGPFEGSERSSTWKLNRKSWAPPQVKFFVWLVCQDRCWTADHLSEEGFLARSSLRSMSPDRGDHGTPPHRLSLLTYPNCTRCCPGLGPPLHLQLSQTHSWTGGCTLRSVLKTARKGPSSLVMLTAWWIWKQLNAVIFDESQPDVYRLFSTIRAEAWYWEMVGAKGLSELLPVGPSSMGVML